MCCVCSVCEPPCWNVGHLLMVLPGREAIGASFQCRLLCMRFWAPQTFYWCSWQGVLLLHHLRRGRKAHIVVYVVVHMMWGDRRQRRRIRLSAAMGWVMSRCRRVHRRNYWVCSRLGYLLRVCFLKYMHETLRTLSAKQLHKIDFLKNKEINKHHYSLGFCFSEAQ